MSISPNGCDQPRRGQEKTYQPSSGSASFRSSAVTIYSTIFIMSLSDSYSHYDNLNTNEFNYSF